MNDGVRRRHRPGTDRAAPSVGVLPVALLVTGLLLLSATATVDAVFGTAGAGGRNAAPTAASSLGPPSAASVSARVQVRASRVALGLYAGPGDTAAVASMARWAGRRPTYAMDFLSGASWSTITHPQPQLAPWENTGISMIWGVPILPNSGATLAQGAAGDYDWAFTDVAQALVGAGQGSSIIRLGWEFNGSWFPWQAGGQARQFVRYWRQVVDTMRAVPGADFRFMWSPARGDFGIGNLADYYPGDRWVDYIGLDVYDASAPYQSPSSAWLNIASGPYGLTWAQAFAAAHHEPFALPEWGLWSTGTGEGGGDDPYFVEATAVWVADHPVAILVVWDSGTSTFGGTDPIATREFRRDFG